MINEKNLNLKIELDTKLYTTGILSSIDILDLLLRLQKIGIKTCHIKTGMFDTLLEITNEINKN